MTWIWCEKCGYRMEISVCDIRCPHNKCKDYLKKEGETIENSKVSYKSEEIIVDSPF
ncbi:MAG: hypothetical protein SV062_05140 [Thermodesulfobacteriota bacterium]|nr:hypothetical protein [Thermodesulfobacteriota bacterium]